MQHTQHLSGGHSDTILCVDHDVHDGLFATGGENGEVCLWNSTGKLLRKTVMDADNDCNSVCFTKQVPGTLFAAVGSKIIRCSCSNLQNPVHTFMCNSDEINQIALDSSDRYLAACDDKGEVRIMDLRKRKIYKTLRNKHTSICSSVCFHPTCPTDLFSAGLDQKLIHWIFPQHRAQAVYNVADILAKHHETAGYMVNPPLIYHLDVSRSGQWLACGLQSGHIVVFNSSQRDLKLSCSLKAHGEGVAQVRFLSDDFLVSGGNDARIKLWDLEKLTQGMGEPCEGGNDAKRQPDVALKERDVSKMQGSAEVRNNSSDSKPKHAEEDVGLASGNVESHCGSPCNSCTSEHEITSKTEGKKLEVGARGEGKTSSAVCCAEADGDASMMSSTAGRADVMEQRDGGMASNVSGSPTDLADRSLLLTFEHSSKVNWFVPYKDNEEWFLAVADQSSSLSILKLSIP